MEVVQAQPSDAVQILALRHSLEEWLEARGIVQWGRNEVSLADVERQVAGGEWWVTPGVDDLAGALRLMWADPQIWGEERFAAYAHGLMVDRSQAGRGVGAALLAWVEEQALAAGASLLRLDCVETNAALRGYYRSQGFIEVGRRDMPDPWNDAVLLEKVIGNQSGRSRGE